MQRATKNEALKRAARDLCLPNARSTRPRTPVVREHSAPPRSSMGPTLQKPAAITSSNKPPGNNRQFSTSVPNNKRNTIINFVPQGTAIVVEKFGKFHKVLQPGVQVLPPWPIASCAYEFTLKEQVYPITPLQSFTLDNMPVTISGMVFFKIVDPQKTAYGVQYYWDAVNKLAQSTMRTALGNLRLDEVLNSRESLHALVVNEMNKAAGEWGIHVGQYNITELNVPKDVQDSMQQLVTTKRLATAAANTAEGIATAAKLEAEGRKAAVELNSQAERMKLTNEAEGRANATRLAAEAQAEATRLSAVAQADSIRAVGDATAYALKTVAESLTAPGATDAAVVQLTKQYTEAFGQLAKTTNSTVFLPTGQSPAEVVGNLTAVASRLFANNAR